MVTANLTKKQEQSLKRCIEFGKKAGCPRDQVERFVKCGYIPLPWQWEFHAGARAADLPGGPVMLGCGGARGPGKSHAVLSQMGLDDCQRIPNLKGLFLRQTGKAAKESFEDLIQKTIKGKVDYEYKAGMLRFPNGSRILLGGFKDDRDVDKYVGIEYDVIGGEELNQLTGERVNKLRGSLRTSKPDWRPRMYGSFNPGGVGHGFVKSTFVEPYNSETESRTRFYPSTYKDNPFLNEEYNEYLEELDGQLGRAWREGDFDILAGTFFTSFDKDIHVTIPIDLPKEWRRICCLDYGFTAPSALYWCAIAPNGQIFVYRELYVKQHTYEDLAEEFVRMTPPDERIDYLVADPSCWNKDGRSKGGLSGIEIFEQTVHEKWKSRELETGQRALHIVAGNNDRIQGWNVLRKALKPYHYDGKIIATLVIFDTCTELIRTIPLMVHAETGNPEDLDTNLEDHGVDSIRYLVMSSPTPKMTEEQLRSKNFEQAMKRKKQYRGAGNRRERKFVK